MTKNRAGLFPELEKAEYQQFTSGILPSQRIEELIETGRIYSSEKINPEQVQPASIDLRLGSIAYRVRASFLPGTRSTVECKIKDLSIAELDLTKPAVMEKGCVFIVPLLEELALPSNTSAKANPKSTTGRLDIFTRLITDYGEEFELVRAGYKGRLYAEVVSRTFPVGVKAGMKLNQLRFIKGQERASDTQLAALDEREGLVYNDLDTATQAYIDQGLRISLDLQGSDNSDVVAYKAKLNAPVIHLDKLGYYDPTEFWDRILSRASKGIILEPGDFYLLASKEKLRVPPTFAAEMVPFDPSIGEFRIHYAGFFDPGFGYGTSDILGTKAVLEVRAHEVPIFLEEGQTVGRLIYNRMLAAPCKVYGLSIGSSYQQQGLALSKQFKRPGQN